MDGVSEVRPITIDFSENRALPEPQPRSDKIVGARDYFSQYFQSDIHKLQPEELLSIEGYPPEEELFCFDDVITIHRFAQDKNKHYWLIKNPEKDDPENNVVSEERLYDLGRALDLGLTETQFVDINGVNHRASRFLINSVDMAYGFQDLPSQTVSKIASDLSGFWPFCFLLHYVADTQYIYTPEGHVALIDYSLPDMPDLESDGPTMPTLKKDVAIQRAHLDEYRTNFSRKLLPPDPLAIRKTIDLITKIPDYILESLFDGTSEKKVARLYDYTNGVFTPKDVEYNSREENVRNIKWRRDHITEVFADYLGPESTGTE
jgi:hypothetical protein